MSKHTSPEEREAFFRQHQAGSTYRLIADQHGVSMECVRYWCRHQRDGGRTLTVYHRQPQGILSHFDHMVRYVILRLRLEHPRWEPERIRHHLTKHPSLRGLRLPSPASIGRYLHQWPRFRRRPKSRTPPKRRLRQPQFVHQRWQVDFKEKIPVADGHGALLRWYSPCPTTHHCAL
jgi:transposase